MSDHPALPERLHGQRVTLLYAVALVHTIIDAVGNTTSVSYYLYCYLCIPYGIACGCANGWRGGCSNGGMNGSPIGAC